MCITEEQGHDSIDGAQPDAHLEDAGPYTPDGSVCADELEETDVPVKRLIDYYEALKRLEESQAVNNQEWQQACKNLNSASDEHDLLQEAHDRIAELEHRLLDVEVGVKLQFSD